MSTPHSAFNRRNPPPFVREGGRTVVFDPKATEVSILDRSGHAIWRKQAGEVLTQIRWDGIDQSGRLVQTGDYVCKIVYPNDRVAYLPFVFVTGA